jgi:hypothetical protein
VLAGLIEANPCKQVQRRKLLPKRRDEDAPPLRVTLLLSEVETMCAWVHPLEQHRPATERLQGKLRLAYALGRSTIATLAYCAAEAPCSTRSRSSHPSRCVRPIDTKKRVIHRRASNAVSKLSEPRQKRR